MCGLTSSVVELIHELLLEIGKSLHYLVEYVLFYCECGYKSSHISNCKL